MTTIFQQSLFPSQKGDFNKEDFERIMEGTPFIACLRTALLKAVEQSLEINKDGEFSLRLQSSIIHEIAFARIQDELSLKMPDADFTYSNNVLGSERLFFKYYNYVFVLKLKDCQNNQTQQSQRIIDQESDYHILTVEYSLDKMKSGLQSLYLLYRKGKNIDYIRNIPVYEMDYSFDEVQPIERKKPILKGVKKAQAV